MKEIIEEIKVFNRSRDFGKDHSPKNLAMSIMIEAAELAENFQWISERESYHPETIDNVEDELADVFIYALNLCSKLKVDPIESIKNKLSKNRLKYPPLSR